MLKTKKQSQVSVSGLSYNNLLQDVYNAIKDSDSFKNNFQDFTSNSSERLIAELYVYVATQLANRLDQMGNELFVDTASAAGLSRLLKLVGAKIDFPAAASVDVQVTSSTNTNTLTFTTGIDQGDDVQELNFTSSSFMSVSDTKGNTWEFIGRSVGDNGEFIYDYAPKSDIFVFNPPQANFTLYEGKTSVKEYAVLSTDVDIVTLKGPVIKDSVRVYYKDKVLSKGTTNTYEISEFQKVESFFTTDALTATIGTYTVRNMGNGECDVCLKPYSNDSETDVGKELLIMYRVGGGANGNISIGAINKTERFNTIGNASAITGTGTYTIKNTSAGAGGKDELTAEEIRNTVVQEVRNTKIAVTEEDYEYLLPKYDSEIELIKCYGEKDSETSDLAETYGYYANPIAVWLLILKYNKQIDETYMNGASGLTDVINDISFNTFDINPRFNEKYQINEASLNILYRAAELNSYFNDGVYQLPIEEESALNILKKRNASITVTNSPYIESSVSNKRGVGCFQRYGKLNDSITWAELLALKEGAVGDVYLITDADINEGVNFRWKCIKAFEAQIAEADVLTYWEQVTSPYVYANLVSDTDDKQYITQNKENTKFNAVYSNEDCSFSGDYSSLPSSWKTGADGFNFGLTGTNKIIMTINGTEVVFDSKHSTFNTAQNLCDYINAKFGASTNVIWLKKNVSADLNADPGSVTLPKTPAESETLFTLTSNETAKQITLGVSGITTYGGLVTALGNALPDTYEVIWTTDNDCWNLGIICADEFTYQDNASSISAENGLYTDILGNTVDTWPLSSETLELTVEQATTYAGFAVANNAFAFFKNGKLVFGFEDDECSLLITATEPSRAQTLRTFFGLNASEEKPYTKLNKRTFTVIYTENSAYLQITMTSKNEELPPNKDLYINVFGGSNERIKLGQYYEDFDDSDTISSLLKRGPIKHLYSTSYIDGVLDKYGSEYQLKLSSQKVESQTFNQLSSGQAPAQIATSRTKNTSMPYYGEGSYLYMKVDNADYEGGVEITVNKNTYTVPSVDGYARFDMGWFVSSETTAFVDAIVKVFDGLLNKKDADEDKLTIYTESSQFYSSIDFGTTLTTILANLFGVEDTVINSEEGQIDVKQINYGKIALTSNLAIGASMKIAVTNTSGASADAEINLGYSYNDFAKAVSSSDVKDYIVIDNNRIILKDLTNGVSATVTIAWSSAAEYNTWKKMFLDTSWIGELEYSTSTDADGKEVSTVKNGRASKTFTNAGQYYIDYDEAEGTYYFVVQDKNYFPCGDIYFHMYEDYSADHVVEETDAGVVQTDEYTWNNLMTNKRVMLTEHIYKQPRFVPFDLSITCYLPNSKQYSQTDYATEIEEFLRTQYGVYANNVGEGVLADDIILTIKEAFTEIKKVTVNYLGYDITNSATNEASLTSKFNQKHILASNEISSALVSDASAGVVTSQTVTAHGLEIELKYV